MITLYNFYWIRKERACPLDIHVACENGHENIVHLVLNNGADSNLCKCISTSNEIVPLNDKISISFAIATFIAVHSCID